MKVQKEAIDLIEELNKHNKMFTLPANREDITEYTNPYQALAASICNTNYLLVKIVKNCLEIDQETLSSLLVARQNTVSTFKKVDSTLEYNVNNALRLDDSGPLFWIMHFVAHYQQSFIASQKEVAQFLTGDQRNINKPVEIQITIKSIAEDDCINVFGSTQDVDDFQ